jgi:hypothetical protein
VAERLAPLPRGVDRDLEPFIDGPLSHHVLHPLRSQGAILADGLVGCLHAGLTEGFHEILSR